MRRHTLMMFLLMGILAVALAGCGGDDPVVEISAPPVLVKRAVSQNVVDRIQATGQLLAQAEATVAAQVGGEVTAIAADEGAPVTTDQVVIEIDPEKRKLELESAGASVVEATAQLEEARRDTRRLETLAGSGAASQQRVEEARTRLDLARARLVAAQARLGLAQRAVSDASVTAPFDGLVARRYVNAGEYVDAGTELFDLVSLDPVEVEFHLSEVDSPRVAVGQAVEVNVAAFPGETFEARVSVVSPTIDRTTRTRRVKALLPNPDGRLLPGTFARVDLGVSQRDGVVMIPKEAVLERSDGSVIFRLVEPNRVERLRIETAAHRDDLVEVRGDVRAGDRIVVRGQTALIDGSAVSLRNEDGTEASTTARVAAEGQGG